MSELSIYYLDLVGYSLLLSAFMPAWVFLILGFQVLSGKGVMAIEKEYNFLEFFWTFLPTVAVAILCTYNVHSITTPVLDSDWFSALVIGNQWYWSYSVDGAEAAYDSMMLDFINSVDKPLRLDFGKIYVMLVSSADVIHSFSIPAFNLKSDAMPGRVNKMVFCPNRLGVFVGYCSELCGAGHAYMPIVLEVVEGSL